MSTYRAFQVTGHRQFRTADREPHDPSPGQVRLRIEACGVCHSGVLAVDGLRADPAVPRVPGHEIAGVIDAVGADEALRLGAETYLDSTAVDPGAALKRLGGAAAVIATAASGASMSPLVTGSARSTTHHPHLGSDMNAGNDLNRRTVLGAAALALGTAAAGSGATGTAALPGPGGAPPFGPVRQIEAGPLSVGYVELGPAHGRPVVLLHGFPYDVHSYVDVAPPLAREGYRVVVPYLRGHGTTTFRSATTPRSGEQVAFALDVLALMDALGIGSAILAGYDWGSRTADIIAALWPERCHGLVSVTGYLITNLAANRQPLPPAAENAWWYQYYFATERGALGLATYRRDLGRFVWTFNSPTWRFGQAVYDRTAAAFDNPDWVTIVLANYRWRLGLIPGEPQYADLEATLQQAPTIGVPTITIDGARDPFTPAGDGSAYRAHFTGRYQHRTLDVGHNVPQEAPRDFARAVIDADRL